MCVLSQALRWDEGMLSCFVFPNGLLRMLPCPVTPSSSAWVPAPSSSFVGRLLSQPEPPELHAPQPPAQSYTPPPPSECSGTSSATQGDIGERLHLSVPSFLNL